MRTLLVLVLIVVVAGVVHAAPADRRIVPGERIGHLRLEMRTAEAVRALGEPAERRPGEQVWLGWPREGLGAWFRDDRIVTIMLRENRAYRTAEGIGIGTERERVLEVHGAQYTAEEDAYSLVITYKRGIAFGFDKRLGTAVNAILVFKAKP